MSTVAIIHARGGSKRLPRKNVLPLHGKPLLAYPIELCRQCAFIDRIIVSTDDDEIMAVAREWGAEVPFRRPADISEDVPSELVTAHALKFLRDELGLDFEYAVTLTPATPFTKPSQLEEAFSLLTAHPQWDAVTAVRATEEHPEWMLRRNLETGRMETIFGNPLDGKYNVSQNLDRFYYPTGAFWINRVAAFQANPSLYGACWGAIKVDPKSMVDIDTAAQLQKAAELFARKEQNS
jgi:N-acylneuraminate cytidylyltransferase